ncbi:MAG: hypothetical protein WC453_00775 [Patescibacteria group bacterium]
MEQLIGIVAILIYLSYIFGHEKDWLKFSERFKERWHRQRRRRLNHHEYIEQVVDSANEKYWVQKRAAADKERVKKNFL